MTLDPPNDHGRLTLAVTAFMAMAASALSNATFEYMVVPLQIELSLSSDQVNAAALVPNGASLLVVFVVGAVGDRFGQRRIMMAGAASFIAGAVLVAASSGFIAVILGRALSGVGALTMSIIGLAAVNAAYRDEGQRARVFAAYAALVPALFVTSPLIGSWLTTNVGWRVVPVLWMLLGVAVLAMAWRFLPTRSLADHPHGEMVTPILAGVALAGLASTATLISSSGMLAAASLTVGMFALAVLVVVMRRASAPTLDLRVFRVPGAVFVFLAALIASMPNLFFYTNLLIQYRYTLPLTEIALLLAIPQMAAVAGGLSSAPLVRRIGSQRAAVVMLFIAAVTSLGTLLVRPESGVWAPVLALAVCAAPIAGSIGPLTKSIMDLAPVDGSAAASSWRNAVWSFGGTVGGVIVAGTAFTVFQSALAGILNTTDLTTEQAASLAASVRDGAIVADLANNPLVTDPAARELLTGPGLLAAQSQAYATAGMLAAGLYVCAAIAMIVAIRRRAAHGASSAAGA